MRINENITIDSGHAWRGDSGESKLISLRFLNNLVASEHVDAFATEKLSMSPDRISLLDIGFGRNRQAGSERTDALEAIGIYFSGASHRASSTGIIPDTLTIKHFLGCGVELPIESDSFDFICCDDIAVDFLDFRNIIGELSRILKKDGILFYDAFNRTSVSQLIILKIMQELGGASIPHSKKIESDHLIQPRDLLLLLEKHYLVNQGQCSSLGINYVFHYYNLRKQREKIPEELN